MSYHILHVLRHGAFLAKEEGFIVCKDKDEIIGRMATEDIRAVIIAARGVSMSSNVLSALTGSGALILHCDENYKPCGITCSLTKTVSREAAFVQADMSLKLHENIWEKILASKISNQAAVLKILEANPNFLFKQLEYGNPSEANCSRVYWKQFFEKLGEPGSARGAKEATPLNAKLNYAYAVLTALIHRSVIAHGLNPLFGIHHKSRPKAHPLVYDLMEPLRPFVDLFLFEFEEKGGGDMKNWAKHSAHNLKSCKIRHSRYSFKLMDSIDVYVNSVAESFRQRSIKYLDIPTL